MLLFQLVLTDQVTWLLFITQVQSLMLQLATACLDTINDEVAQ